MSIAYWHSPAIEWIIIVLMTCSGITGHVPAGHALQRDHCPPQPVVDIDQLRHDRDVPDEDVVRQHDAEVLPAAEGLPAQHGMPQPQRLPLPDIKDLGEVRDPHHHVVELVLAPGLEQLLQLEGTVEVVLDRPLGPSRDHDDVGAPRGQGLLDAIGDDGPIHQRQHLLGYFLGHGKETGPQARDGEKALRHLCLLLLRLVLPAHLTHLLSFHANRFSLSC